MKNLKFILALMVFGLFMLAAGGSDDSSKSTEASYDAEPTESSTSSYSSSDSYGTTDDYSSTSADLSSASESNGEVGETCTITETCFAATDEDSWDEMYKFIVARDQTGIAEMMAAGQVINVSAGTRAKIIDYGFTKVQVRLETGELVYVPSDYVQK